MLAVYLQPDSLKIVQGRIRKDNVLEIKDYRNLSNAVIGKNYFNILIAASSAGKEKNIVDKFADLFREIKKISGYRWESVYLVLPDFLFYRIDCFSYDKEADMEEQIRSFLGINLDEIYYSVPILTNPAPKENRATVYSIERKYIDIIIEAAKCANVRLESIEASSISFLRASGKFQKEEFIFQGYENNATIIAYSSIGGLFTVNMPELSIENLDRLLQSDKTEALIRSTIARFESMAEGKFKNINDDIPITILSNYAFVKGFKAFKGREGGKQKFAKFIFSDIPENEQQEWMPAVGTLMQYGYSDSLIIDDYETILSGNLLSDKIQKNSKFQLLFAKIKKNRYFMDALLFVVLLLASIICALVVYTIKESFESKPEYWDTQENYEDIFQRHKPKNDSLSIKLKQENKGDKSQINSDAFEKTTDISATSNPAKIENDVNKNIVGETAVTLPQVPAIRVRSATSVPANIPLPVIPQNSTPPKEMPKPERKVIIEDQVAKSEDAKNITIISENEAAEAGYTYGDGRIAFIGGDGIEFNNGFKQ